MVNILSVIRSNKMKLQIVMCMLVVHACIMCVCVCVCVCVACVCMHTHVTCSTTNRWALELNKLANVLSGKIIRAFIW